MHFVKKMKKMFDVKVVDDDPDKVVWERENLFMSAHSPYSILSKSRS